MKSNIRYSTAFAVIAAFSSIGGNSEASETRPFPTQPVPLTTGETALIRGIFNEAVNTEIIRKTFSPKYIKQDKKTYTAANVGNKKDITFHGLKYHEHDYSKAKHDFNFGLFPHEVTHIWQFQTNMRFTNGRCNLYKFAIQPSNNFENFCDEQQAEIIENYARRFLHNPALKSEDYYTKTGNIDTPQSDRTLQRLVESYFPQARTTRLKLETKNLKGKRLLAL